MAPPTPDPGLHGHFSGLVQSRGETWYGEALFTVDGAVRIYVGGPLPVGEILSGGGLPSELLITAKAAMFAGSVMPGGGHQVGSGQVFDQVCGDVDAGRFCDAPASASIDIVATESGFAGELRVATSDGEESWLLDMGAFSAWYTLHAGIAPPGLYQETLARFAQAGDVIMSIDDTGQLYFQSAATGCTGNGLVSPHLDAAYSVWDVDLRIENCNASFAYLNDDFDGLATYTQGAYWDYDLWLLMFLVPRGGAERPVSLTTYGRSL